MTQTHHTNAAFVSCDIVGHGRDSSHVRQLERIQGLNDCIRRICEGHFGNGVVWASGGDGGHVAFLNESLRETAIQLIRELFLWTQATQQQPDSASVRLRLTAHYGPVSIIEGADQRQQLVGDGVNLCGSLLNFGTPGAVLVTAAFREFMMSGRGQGNNTLDAIRFHDERSIYLKHFFAHRVFFLSVPGEFNSQWGFPEKSDRVQLVEAIDTKRPWRAIYHAKRLLQVDSSDKDAKKALNSINPKQLTFKPRHDREEFEINPLVGQMNKLALRELILASHLIERDDGELICAQEDSGDAMFIVLKGQIGVVLNCDANAEDDVIRQPLDLRYGEGQILGELALALQRKRTATLQAVGPTAMLSINYSTLRNLLESKPRNVRLERSFNDLLLNRILQNVCRNVPYLAGTNASPLHDIEDPWDQLMDDSECFTFSWRDIELISASDERFRGPGLYVLVGGRLTEASQSDKVRKVMNEDDFPLLFVDLPNDLVNVHHKYRIDPNADFRTITILRISDRVLQSWGPNVYAKVVDAVKKRLASQFLFDVFISYNHRDEHIAQPWCDAMTKAGLLVYMSQPEAMRRFKVEIELALAESLVMVPFVSIQAKRADGEESWVQREIRYRRTLFDADNSNILPIELTSGIASEFADGFSAVTITGSGEDAVEKTINTIRAVREGLRSPPFARRRAQVETI